MPTRNNGLGKSYWTSPPSPRKMSLAQVGTEFRGFGVFLQRLLAQYLRFAHDKTFSS